MAEILERLQQAPEVGSQIARADFKPRWQTETDFKMIEGVGETLGLADALDCHPEPGRRGTTA